MALTKITGEGVGAVDNLTVDTNTLHVDAANNRVGVGTTSPSTPLEVSGTGTVSRVTSSDANVYFALGNSVNQGGYVGYESSALTLWSNSGRVLRVDSDGLKVGSDTGAANALDDYEIGSISSGGLSDASGAGLSLTFNSGNYVKVGDMVAFELDFSFPINSNGSTAEVTCLPFTQVGNFGAGAIGYHTRGGFTSSYILGATQKVRFASSAGSNFTNANLSNVRFIITYIYRSS